MTDAIRPVNIDTWTPPAPVDGGAGLAWDLEAGRVLHFPKLGFVFGESEQRFLDPRWSNGAVKNISLEKDQGSVKGATGTPDDLTGLDVVIGRFRSQASSLVKTLLPRYAAHLRTGRTSYRPVRVEGRSVSWRKDDSRLHVDAFPSRPTNGERILRLFANVNPHGDPRVWRVGEPFEDMARRLLPRIPRPWRGSAWLLATLGVTKSRRSEYDHFMLGLHDAMKYDTTYQCESPQATLSFAPGTIWICFSDQTSHAAMSGQFMLEQTMYLPLTAHYEPARSPLRTLERLTGRALV